MVLAILAYLELAAVSSDVYDVLDNWQTSPIVNITLVDWGDECPAGYLALALKNSDFPGVQKGHCGCTPNMYSFGSTYANCSDEAEVLPECMSYVAKSRVEAESWRGRQLCILRGGQPAESWSSGYKQRPHPTSDGKCPTGYRRCGQGLDHNLGNAICFREEDELCPLTNIVVAGAVPSGVGWFAIGQFDDSYSLYGKREGLGEFPLIDLQLKLTSQQGDEFRDGESYSTGSQDRGPCYTGMTQVLTSA